MKAGILSDSHDQRGFAEDALALFREEGVGVILHLGDVCRPETIDAYRGCGIPLVGVYGNNDSDKEGLQAVSGSGFHQGPYMPEIGGRKVLMAHSFDELQEEIGEGGRFDLILFGHTHRPLTMRIGRALILNPGEACGFISGKATCGLIDLDKMEASIREIRAGAAMGRNLPGDAARQRRIR
ncbi:MAG: metallophosphoesterase [Candidatus Deferrimicrobiaceae bacterium]